jgi:hypothetical protein
LLKRGKENFEEKEKEEVENDGKNKIGEEKKRGKEI